MVGEYLAHYHGERNDQGLGNELIKPRTRGHVRTGKIVRRERLGVRHLDTVYPWEFEKSSREVKIRVEGQLTVNGIDEMLVAARQGMGIALVPEDLAEPYIKSGELKVVLDDCSQPFAGYYLYYPSRKHTSPAFSLVVDALRHRATARR